MGGATERTAMAALTAVITPPPPLLIKGRGNEKGPPTEVAEPLQTLR
jgi:hypothetical protein